MHGVGSADPLAAGREAMGRADWAAARRHYAEAVAADPSAEALEGLSQAAWWDGDEETTFETRERSYRAYREAGDARGAARMAMSIGAVHLDFRGRPRGRHRLARAGAALADGPCPELAATLLFEADIAVVAEGDHATAERKAREALDLARGARGCGRGDGRARGAGQRADRTGRGSGGPAPARSVRRLGTGRGIRGARLPGLGALPHRDRLRERRRLRARGPVVPGDAALDRELARPPVLRHLPDRVWPRPRHAGTVARRRGRAAERDRRPEGHAPVLAAPSSIRLGELRVRQGRRDEARALFEAALPMPQAVLCVGELELDAGDPAAATDAAERVLRRLDADNLIDRVPALELLARASAAAGDEAAAETAAAAVERAAAQLGTPYMRGRARAMAARVLSAADDHDGARLAAEDAVDLFGECSAPYEAAQARIVLSRSLKALGHADRAQAEAETARVTLTRLGADAEARRATDAELSPRELEILRLVAEGLNDPEIAERLFLSRHTVHRHVANVRAKLRTPSRAAAVAEANRLQLF